MSEIDILLASPLPDRAPTPSVEIELHADDYFADDWKVDTKITVPPTPELLRFRMQKRSKTEKKKSKKRSKESAPQKSEKRLAKEERGRLREARREEKSQASTQVVTSVPITPDIREVTRETPIEPVAISSIPATPVPITIDPSETPIATPDTVKRPHSPIVWNTRGTPERGARNRESEVQQAHVRYNSQSTVRSPIIAKPRRGRASAIPVRTTIFERLGTQTRSTPVTHTVTGPTQSTLQATSRATSPILSIEVTNSPPANPVAAPPKERRKRPSQSQRKATASRRKREEWCYRTGHTHLLDLIVWTSDDKCDAKSFTQAVDERKRYLERYLRHDTDFHRISACIPGPYAAPGLPPEQQATTITTDPKSRGFSFGNPVYAQPQFYPPPYTPRLTSAQKTLQPPSHPLERTSSSSPPVSINYKQPPTLTVPPGIDVRYFLQPPLPTEQRTTRPPQTYKEHRAIQKAKTFISTPIRPVKKTSVAKETTGDPTVGHRTPTRPERPPTTKVIALSTYRDRKTQA